MTANAKKLCAYLFCATLAICLTAINFMAAEPVAHLIISQTHSGSFQQGDIGDTYTFTVTNVGTVPTVGAVTVTDSLPVGLTVTSLGGSGWSCTAISLSPLQIFSPLSCTRSDSLAAGASYQPIVLTVNVGNDAPACSHVADGLTFQPGDILLSMGDGNIQWRHHNWSLVKLLASVTDGQAKGMGFDSCGNLLVTHWFGAGFTGNDVVKFDRNGNITGLFGSGYNCNPTSIAFGTNGSAYVGQSDCGAQILQFDPQGNQLSQYHVAVENRGSSHVILDPDQCTMYYTSEGPDVKRFNVCTNKQMPDFNTAPLPDPIGGAHEFSLLPGGGMLVANFGVIARLDASGTLVGTFNTPSVNYCWLGMALDPDGTSFWASNWCESSVTHFNLATGNVIESHVADDRGFMVKQIATPPSVTGSVPPNTPTVSGGSELPPGTPPSPPVPPTPPPGNSPPTLTVIKYVKPSPDGSEFNLQIGGVGYVNGNQSAVGVGNGGSTGAIVLSPGIYTVGEKLVSADPVLGPNPTIGFYTNNVSCFKNGSTTPFAIHDFNISAFSFAQPDAVSLGGVTLTNGDNVVCAIINTLKAHMPLHKLVNGTEQTAGNGIAEWTFNLYAWDGKSATPTSYNQYPGGYLVSENLPRSIDPWVVGTYSLCEMGQAQAPNNLPGLVLTDSPGPYIGILPGWTETWTFTVNGAAQDLNVYDPDISLGHGSKGIRCVNFTINPGEKDIFIIDNIQKSTPTAPGAITIVKNTVGGDGTFEFSSNFGLTSLTTHSGTANHTFDNLTPGSSYSVSETVPEGWTQTSARCSNGTPAAITVVAGETTICTITNSKGLVPLPPPGVCGRFTGGGSIFLSSNKDARVTHGFELHCTATDLPNNLEVNFGTGDQFHMTTLLTAACTLDAFPLGAGKPSAPFDTITGVGTGTYDGVAGATVNFTITDHGEPGTSDTLQITVKAADGSTVLNAPTTALTFGNQQAHSCGN